MTKAEFAELCIINLSGGNPVSAQKFDKRDFYGYLEMAMTEMLNAMLKVDKNVDGGWIKTYEDVPLLWNEDRGVVFLKLPADIMSLRGDRGLQAIQPMKSETDIQYYISSPSAISIFNELEAGNLDSGFECYLEGSNVVIPKMKKHLAAAPVKVKIIPAVNAYEDDDQLIIPGDTSDTIFEKVLRIASIQAKIQQKTTNDQNPNTR